MTKFGQIIASMIGTIAVIDLIAIILQGTKDFDKADTKKERLIRILSLGLLGGLFGMYATINGFEMTDGIIIAVRDVGPMMAGCLGGPLCGLISGIIAGIHRFWVGLPDYMAGATIPCSIATILIGLACGALFKPFKLKENKGRFAFVIGVVMEVLHLFTFFIYKWILTDVTTSWNLILDVAPSFLLANGLAFGLLVYTTDMIDRYKLAEIGKEKMEAELDTATKIQEAMLPIMNENITARKEFDVFANMIPAKQVGGDFYDFYFVDDDHFAFSIADVSGKGVPAALFMAISKMVIKNNVQTVKNIDEAIEKANIQLYEENKESMFVTAWIGVLEISSGKLTYINAGHNPPVIKKANGEIEYLKNRSGFVLAGNQDSKYKKYEIQLEKDDIIFAYTDGVTEANVADKFYGEEKLLDVLSNTENNLEKICKDVKSDIDKFVGNAIQFDDITMIAFKYNGGDTICQTN